MTLNKMTTKNIKSKITLVEMSVDEISVDKMTIDKMSVDKMTVDLISVGKMTEDKTHVKEHVLRTTLMYPK